MRNISSYKKWSLIFLCLTGLIGFFGLLAIANHFEEYPYRKLEFLSFEFSKSIVIDIYVHLAAATVIGVIVTIFLKHFNELDLTNKLDELKEHLFKVYPRILYVSYDEGLFQIIQHLNQVDKINGNIFTIGIGKSEFYKKSRFIKEYYSTTEKILNSDDFKGVYKRITIEHLKEQNFVLHLINCLEANKKHDDTRATILLSDNEHLVSDTFFILDKKFLFISPTSTESDGNEKVIGKSCFITEDKDIIEQYTKHFNDIWDRNTNDSKTVTSDEDFRRSIKS